MSSNQYPNLNPANPFRYKAALKNIATTGNNAKDFVIIGEATSLDDLNNFILCEFSITDSTTFNANFESKIYILDIVKNTISSYIFAPNVVPTISNPLSSFNPGYQEAIISLRQRGLNAIQVTPINDNATNYLDLHLENLDSQRLGGGMFTLTFPGARPLEDCYIEGLSKFWMNYNNGSSFNMVEGVRDRVLNNIIVFYTMYAGSSGAFGVNFQNTLALMDGVFNSYPDGANYTDYIIRIIKPSI